MKSRILSTIFFTLATATRSNGSLLFIFPLSFYVNAVIVSWINGTFQLSKTIKELFFLGIQGFIQATPIFSVLIYGYSLYCNDVKSPYCSALFPNIYNYIQKEYWNVGLFLYWEPKQIPNFLLAMPMILISVTGIAKYLKADFRRVISFGAICKEGEIKKGYLANNLIFPFMFYWGINLVILVFIANVQIITRMVCSLPAIYWYLNENFFEQKKLILFYFCSYLLLGPLLFSNFYPWT
jgi:GPI mannosyltransferase 2